MGYIFRRVVLSSRESRMIRSGSYLLIQARSASERTLRYVGFTRLRFGRVFVCEPVFKLRAQLGDVKTPVRVDAILLVKSLGQWFIVREHWADLLDLSISIDFDFVNEVSP